jgi:hypothetical protein
MQGQPEFPLHPAAANISAFVRFTQLLVPVAVLGLQLNPQELLDLAAQ